MKLCRVYSKDDGSVAVVHAAPKSRKEKESDEAFISRVSLRAVQGTELENLQFKDILIADLPDRKDRDKWTKCSKNGVKVKGE